jgi:hypothetical protein
MFNHRRSTPRRVAVLELSRERLSLSVLSANEEERSLSSQRVGWNHDAGGTFASIEQAEVLARLREMIGDEKFAGTPIHLVLSGDYCVTRTVAGTREQVERELRDLRERCGLYISLGQGPKAYSENVRTIDARRAQGSMTVTNQQSLAAITDAAREAGFKVKSIEHSLVALSRVVGHTALDAELPVIIVELNESGIDLGISYQGHLLLDYRPGGLTRTPGEQRQLPEIILKHLGRIRRYCHRYFQYSGGKLSRVVLSGQEDEIEALRQHFDEATDLQTITLHPKDVCPQWTLPKEHSEDCCLLPTLGAMLLATQEKRDDESPNLLTPLLLAQREPIGPALIKHGWPVALALAVSLLAFAVGLYEDSRSGQLFTAVEQARRNADLLATRQMELTSIDAKIKHLSKLGDELHPPAWDHFLADVSGCLPQGAWLESLKIDRAGTVYLNGPSFYADRVYELVNQLKELPSLADVVLEGTRPTRLDSGPATVFDVKCKYRGRSDNAKGT